jgi:hypothetical protein
VLELSHLVFSSLRIKISYNFQEIVDSQIIKFMPFFYIETLEKCYLLKMWHVIKAARKNFSPKIHIFFFNFCKDASYLENQKTIFCLKLFYKHREKEHDKNILNY